VLVATTVIEVGVDVPNATIYRPGGDRFASRSSTSCGGWPRKRSSVLPADLAPKDELTDTAQARLQALVETTDASSSPSATSSCGGRPVLGTRSQGRTSASRLRTDRELLERPASSLASSSTRTVRGMTRPRACGRRRPRPA